MKKLWFFDLDGTLADTDRDIREAWKATLADLGLECPSFDAGFVAGPPIEDMARTLFPEIYTDVEYPGIVDRVRALKAAGATVVVATNKRYVGAMLIARKFGWERVFDGIYAGDMFKDDPAVGKMTKSALLAFLMRKYAAAPGDCTIVGDTKSDFLAAKDNGIESVGVAWGYGMPEELALADRIAHTPAEV